MYLLCLILAVDFQNCGISSVGAERVLELIKENKYLSIVDIRANNNVIPAMVTDIMALLAENNADEIPAVSNEFFNIFQTDDIIMLNIICLIC